MSTSLIIFAKNPISGKVKTRLTPYINPTEAAELYQAFITDIVSNIHKLKCEQVTIAYTPSNAEAAFHSICGQSVDYLPQKGDNLGERMKNAFMYSFDKGSKRTVIIGTDSPTLPSSYIQKAFDALKEVPVTVGPTFDGGYYLIGLSGQNYAIFDGIDWSTSKVFGQTLTRIQAINKQLYVLPPWYDVDTPDNLEFLRSHILSMKMSGTSELPNKTMQFLKM
ncbi:MAG: TIGR04282 family arsenosugar biosynthesis glycosyltransferase [Candidatus Scalindua rubra]|uniref:Putative glycosyltransferase n=1 Tax=Candidatus Scalindua brodae TaxID=237368 RepID=A0A0B0EAE9_9BACT|nr:MAG: putative glycosyltransferase [Candidatus Scalindua brodae]MBZ0108263.1 TIGR04282 family arsenosugar biosynthesis glycosyltransferase [Candidatus Scalindua rubra]